MGVFEFLRRFVLQPSFSTFTKIPIGCHDFTGSVRCEDYSAIRDIATVELHEIDVLGNDLLETKPLVKDGVYAANFRWRCCYHDGSMTIVGLPVYPNIEVFYVFKNVCREGDSFIGVEVLKNSTTYTLYNGKANLL